MLYDMHYDIEFQAGPFRPIVCKCKLLYHYYIIL